MAIAVPLVAVQLISVQIASAQSAPAADLKAPPPRRMCDVTARLLMARQTPPNGGVATGEGLIPGTAAGATMQKVVVNGFAKDIREQLTALPYEWYHPIDFEQKTVALGETARFELAGEKGEPQLLTVTLHQLVAGRIAASIHWVDSRGLTLLQTKMRIPNGEKVVMGTDSLPQSPVVLSLQTLCP